MKLVWNKTVQTTLFAVLIVAVVPIAYVALFTIGVVGDISRNSNVVEIVGYSSMEECEENTGSTCEVVTAENSDTFWISVDQ